MRIIRRDTMEAILAEIPQNSGVFVILDDALTSLTPLFEGMKTIVIHPTEATKQLSTVERIIERLLHFGADRDSFILGVGGGITTDIAGFTASIYKRGVRLGLLPTTLLAQADAAIGGKNGVNFLGYKNMLGTIREPEWVGICPALLESLPEDVFRQGIPEILKTFAICDAAAYREAADLFASRENVSDSSGLGPIVERCAKLKMEIVGRDLYESGERRLLNFGHTFGHAIERCSGGGTAHGEAVAMGMKMAAQVAERLGLCSAETRLTIENDLAAAGFAHPCPIPAYALTESIRADKKVSGDTIHLILPHAIGDIRDVPVPMARIGQLLTELESPGHGCKTPGNPAADCDERICVCITGADAEGCRRLLEKYHFAEIRADLCHLHEGEIAGIVAAHPHLIFTCRFDPACRDAGERALRLVQKAIEWGAEYIDIAHDAPQWHLDGVKRAIAECGGKTKLILSYHDFDGTPPLPSLLEIAGMLDRRGASLIKIATKGVNLDDCSAILSLYRACPPALKGRLIAFAMGKRGQFTRHLALHLGAPFAYCADDNGLYGGSPLADLGQLTASRMEALLNPESYPTVFNGNSHRTSDDCGNGLCADSADRPIRMFDGIPLPCSKSVAQRAILAAAVAKGTTLLHNYTPCGDTLSAENLVGSLGCRLRYDGEKATLEIDSPGITAWNLPATLHCGESAFLARAILPLCGYLSAIHGGVKIEVSGSGTLLRRDMGGAAAALRNAGFSVESTTAEGADKELLPLIVSATQIPLADLVIDGSGGSQTATGFLFLLPLLGDGATLRVENPVSRPYLDLTAKTLRHFGVETDALPVSTGSADNPSGISGSSITPNTPGSPGTKDGETRPSATFRLSGKCEYKPAEFAIEADWSSAAPLIVGKMVAAQTDRPGKNSLPEGVVTGSCQADEAILEAIKLCEGMQPFEFDATDCPDLFPTLVLLACHCHGESRIYGANRLREKESDRGETLLSEFTKLGYDIRNEGDVMVIRGGRDICAEAPSPPLCSSHNDHRIATALIVETLAAGTPMRIDDISCIGKSFPQLLRKIVELCPMAQAPEGQISMQ